jgi:hypothetical protein
MKIIFYSWLIKFDFTYFLLRALNYYYYYYYYCICPGFSRIGPTTKIKIKLICGGPRDSVIIRSSSWSAKVCPGLLYTFVAGSLIRVTFEFTRKETVSQVPVLAVYFLTGQ